MPIKGQSPKQIVHTEMHKFKHGTLHSGSKKGPLVKSRKQAIAIALSESGQSRKRQSGGNIPIRTPNTLNAMMQGVEQDPLNPHAQLGMLAPYAIPGAPMPVARVKRPIHIDEKSEKEKDKGYAKGGLTFNQRWRDVPIQAEDFGDRFFPGFVGQTHGEESPLYAPLTRRAEEIGQQQAPATFEARWPSKPFGTFPLYQQASPYAVGGPIGNQRAPRQDEDFTDTDRQGGIMAPPATNDSNEMATEELEDKRQFKSGNPPQRYQMGGFNPEKAMSIGLSRRASQGSGGLLKSQIPGRTDQIQASIPKGAYIIPADVVSGMGQGNTDAGGAILGKLMNRGPFNMNLPKRTAGSRVGSRHSSLKFSKKFAEGGNIKPEVASPRFMISYDAAAGHPKMRSDMAEAERISAAVRGRLPPPPAKLGETGFAEGGDTGGMSDVQPIPITPEIRARMERRMQNASSDEETRRVIRDAARYGVDWSHYGRADGGDVGEPEPVLAAGGEYVVMPHEVAALGAGDVDTGHNILDAFVKHMREKTIATMRKLPGPKGAKK